MTLAIAMSVALHLDAVAMSHMLCAEGGAWIKTAQGRRELIAIGQVAKNLSSRNNRPLRTELVASRFASRCSAPSLLPRLTALAVQILRAEVKPPAWSTKALAFTTRKAADRVQASWHRRGFRRIEGTDTEHVFWSRR